MYFPKHPLFYGLADKHELKISVQMTLRWVLKSQVTREEDL